MSFATQEDVLGVCERVIRKVFTEFRGKFEPVCEEPFRRITFAESMLKYGTDKPDLRNPLEICDVTDFFKTVDFPVFRGKTVRAISAPCKTERWFFDKSLNYATNAVGMQGLAHITLLDEKNGVFKDDPITRKLSAEKQKELVALTGAKEGETLFFIADISEMITAKNAGAIRTWLGEELGLINKNRFEFCFIVDFPMFEYDDILQKTVFTHNPFSMPKGGLQALLTQDPEDVIAYQYDLVGNGIELASGAVRNHDVEIMQKAFEIAGYTKEELAERFSALYEAFQFGAPPHAGMAPGVDRIVMLLEDTETIRDVIAFPLDGKAQDQMLGAPNTVSEMQLFEANISIRGTETGTFAGEAPAANKAPEKAPAKKTEANRLRDLENLNQLSLTPEEENKMKAAFEFMEEGEAALEAIDTEAVEPMIFVAPRFNVIREDVRIQPFSRESLLKGAPEADENSWIVPKVVK